MPPAIRMLQIPPKNLANSREWEVKRVPKISVQNPSQNRIFFHDNKQWWSGPFFYHLSRCLVSLYFCVSPNLHYWESSYWQISWLIWNHQKISNNQNYLYVKLSTGNERLESCKRTINVRNFRSFVLWTQQNDMKILVTKIILYVISFIKYYKK